MTHYYIVKINFITSVLGRYRDCLKDEDKLFSQIVIYQTPIEYVPTEKPSQYIIEDINKRMDGHHNGAYCTAGTSYELINQYCLYDLTEAKKDDIIWCAKQYLNPNEYAECFWAKYNVEEQNYYATEASYISNLTNGQYNTIKKTYNKFSYWVV